MSKLEGEIAFITGATAGFGEAMTRLFVSEGAQVIASGRRADRLEKIKNDPTVKQAIEAFDGTLDLESVSPIEN